MHSEETVAVDLRSMRNREDFFIGLYIYIYRAFEYLSVSYRECIEATDLQ